MASIPNPILPSPPPGNEWAAQLTTTLQRFLTSIVYTLNGTHKVGLAADRPAAPAVDEITWTDSDTGAQWAAVNGAWVKVGAALSNPVTAAQGGTGLDTSGSTGVATVAAGTWAILAQLTAALGGTGINSSASTGAPKVSAGTWSVQALTNGQLLIGSTGAVPVAAAPTSSDSTVAIALGAGTLGLTSPLRGTLTFSTGSGAALSTGATSYFAAAVVASTTEADVEINAPFACTARNLYVRTVGASPGAGASYAFTLRKNEADTALTCTVSGTNLAANDTTHTVTIAKGDRLSIKSIPASTPTAAFAVAVIEVQAT